MTTETIEVKYADPPKAGKKQATIKTTGGDIYGIWPDKLGLLQPGRRYNVTYSEREHAGRKYRTITKVDPVQGEQLPPPETSQINASTLEQEIAFVTRVVAAAIQSQQIEFGAVEIGRAARLAQSVFREFVRQSPH